ncbi:ATP-binding protein [Kribbella italica]|uniref:DNA-binding CsgD family transcriptional regulator n=1 Tax=Kribbella italica TaxID=1540520 RepID=A0A7W9J7H5_9ACTN|nr:LuxR family transcriptional regulator [Kribbella italica]MBB5837037.1 DNA-binding CsgD family transcriptional regulator [Kribbella italica]
MEPLRGRSAELGRLLEAMRAADQGTASLTVVTGEPGIGKSALVHAAVEQAERHGLLVATAVAHQTDNISPLSSLAPALRAGKDPLIGTEHFLELAALNTQPLWLAERLADLIGQRLAGTAALIVLDDAQWSDPLTGFVLRVVISRLADTQTMWLLATRPSPGGVTDQVVDALGDQLPVHHLQLAPLDTEAVLQIAADRLNQPADAALTVRLGSAQGVPFLVEQVVAGLYLTDGSPQGPLPDGLVEGVRRRTAGTSELCRSLLRTAAVFGSEFRLEDVAALMAEGVARLAEPLDEAIRAGLLADSGAHLTFRHELLRAAVLADVPPSAQRALHSAIADQLLLTEQGASAAAPHILATAAVGDLGAISMLRSAARDLLTTMSITALSVIQETFELTPVDQPIRGEVGADVVDILLVARQYDAARAFADDLLGGTPLYQGPVTPELAARVRLLLAPHEWATGTLDPSRLIVAAAPQPFADRLAAYQVLAGAAKPFATDDPVTSALLQLAQAEQAATEGRFADAAAAYAAARSTSRPSEVGTPPAVRVELAELFCLAQAGEPAAALQRLSEGIDGDSWLAPQVAVLRAQLELAVGNLPAARDAAKSSLRWSAEFHDPSPEPMARQVLALIALLQGDLSAARKVPDEPVRALLAMADGDAAAAQRLLATPLDHPIRLELLLHAATHAHDAASRSPGTVQAAAELLADQAATAPAAASTGAAQLVAAANQRDLTALAEAVEQLRGSQRPLLVAAAEELHGRVELEHGDRSTGIAALERALDSYTQLGAMAFAVPVQAVLQAAGVRRRRWSAVPARPESGWEALTPMERKVALLVADGHTNRSAAEELVLSASTVGTHLRNVFSKLDVNSRVQLTRLVLQRFTSPPNA